MSRHRNIRSMNYNEEYDTYYDEYGQSVEEDCCISPGTAAEFMYDRTGQSHSMSAYLAEDEQDVLPEEPEEQEENLSAFDQARLQSCLEEIQNIVGETVSEAELKQTVIQHNYDLTKALDSVLRKTEEPKPQRVRRQRNRPDQKLGFGSGSDGSFLNSGWGTADGETPTLSELLGNKGDIKDQSLSQLLEECASKHDSEETHEALSLSKPFDAVLESLNFSPLFKDDNLINHWLEEEHLFSLTELGNGLANPLEIQSLNTDFSGLCLSDLALKPKSSAEIDEQRIENERQRTWKIVAQYFLSYPHDIKEDFFMTLNEANNFNIVNRPEVCPSYLGCFMCLRSRHSKRPNTTPSLQLPSEFDFNCPSPDDVNLSKCSNKTEAASAAKLVEVEITSETKQMQAQPTETNSEPNPTTVILIADKQDSVNKNFQLLGVDSVPAKCGSRNSSRSPSPAPNVATPTLPKKNIRSQENADPTVVYAKERSSQKPLLNLVVIGHVDAGKSTLMGHLLYRLGCVSKKTMHKNEQDSKKMGKSSFMYAWVLDETPEERSRGITMDIAQSRFETDHRTVTLLDAPGHRDFIPNMITGASQADNAILVVDGTRGEFEAGFEAGGQTREHTLLVRSLGVSQLAVAVNKMDNESWSEDRYKEIVSKMATFLKQAGFKESDVQFVPCSGLTGENLTKPLTTDNPQVTWYKGPCLLDIIDNFPAPVRPVSLPFRLCIADIFKGQGSGFCVGGRVESGYVQNGDKVLVMPAGEPATVKGISQEEMPNLQIAFAGDHVTLTLSGIDMNKVMCGDVVCDPHRPIRSTQRFRGRIVTFNLPVPLTQGCPLVLHYQSMSEQAVLKKLISQLHKGTGQVIKKKPRCLPKNTSGIIELEVCRPICVELYKDNRDLGRFMLRAGGTTVAAGLVTQVL